MPIFTIIFEDNTSFEGGIDYKTTKWEEIPNKKIKSIFYNIPFGDYLYLIGYDKYYHMIEATMDLNGDNKGKLIINNIRLMAKKDNKIKIWKFNLLDKNKLIEIEVKNFNDNFIQKLNPNSWKG
jgi:hypothetical protein